MGGTLQMTAALKWLVCALVVSAPSIALGQASMRSTSTAETKVCTTCKSQTTGKTCSACGQGAMTLAEGGPSAKQANRETTHAKKTPDASKGSPVIAMVTDSANRSSTVTHALAVAGEAGTNQVARVNHTTSGGAACGSDTGPLGPRCDQQCDQSSFIDTRCCDSGCGVAEAVQTWSLDLCCNPCAQGLWVRADVLFWWLDDDNTPVLVTSSPGNTPLGAVGRLGLPTTTSEFGGSLADDLRVGGRIRFGYWFEGQQHGLDGSVWGIDDDKDSASFGSSGNPAYARPFQNVDPLVQDNDAQLISYPGVLSGSVAVHASSEVYGGNIGLRSLLCCESDACGSTRLDLISGYRYFRLREGLEVTESLTSTAQGGPVAQGTTINLFDRFRTENQFHGGEIGLIKARQSGRWYGEWMGKVALGSVTRHVRIEGATTRQVPNAAPVTTTGGLLAQSTNIGDFRDSEFAVLPEFQLNLGYYVKPNLKLIGGYSFMFLGNVVRPGDAIDPVVNGRLLDSNLPFAGPNRPEFRWNDSDIWLMGLNVGAEWTF